MSEDWTAGLPGKGYGWDPVGKGRTHFFPDSMKWSYSTAILQDRAWRLCAAEQLVRTTLPVDREGCQQAGEHSSRLFSNCFRLYPQSTPFPG